MQIEAQADGPTSVQGRPALRRLLPILLIVAAAWFGAAWLARGEHAAATVTGQAPPLAITGFDGAPIDLAALRGQGVVLNFWASWCGPCRAEAPLLEAAWQRERDRGIVFVGVNVDDTTDAAQAFLAEFGLSYPNGPDTAERWGDRFGVNGLPTTFFIEPGRRNSHDGAGAGDDRRRTGPLSGRHPSCHALSGNGPACRWFVLLREAWDKRIQAGQDGGEGLRCEQGKPAADEDRHANPGQDQAKETHGQAS